MFRNILIQLNHVDHQRSISKLRSCLVLHPKTFYLSHRIFRYMHKTLNVDKKLIAQFGYKALFSSKTTKKFQDSPSQRILWHMYGILNIDENKN